MNINLDIHSIAKYKHGKIIESLYSFSLQWRKIEEMSHKLPIAKQETERLKAKIKNNERVDPVIMLSGYGIVAGVHTLEGFRALNYKKIPVLFGVLK
jgi:hypothetical protein